MLQPPKILAVPPSTQVLKSLSGVDVDDDIPTPVLQREATKPEAEEEFAEDDFQTPREERPPLSYGAFGEELRPDEDEDPDSDDPKRKKAARTLSLSQLTLGKGQRTQI